MSRECFEAWAPSGNEWSQWAKPAPFIGDSMMASVRPAGPEASAGSLEPVPDVCMVLDLPGAESVRMAVALARKGFRPLPLINTTTGGSEAIDMAEVLAELRHGADALRYLQIPENAPPAFVLDSRREGQGYTPRPRTYDNRWMVFPQDFPSGNFLRGKGIKRAMVLSRQPQLSSDLAHVMRRWQDAGVTIFLEVAGDGQKPLQLTVSRPSMFRMGWYRFLVAIGMKKNSAGGFGGWIPEPSKSGGYG